MKGRWLAALALLLVTPAACAGTAEEPEIQDPAGDVRFFVAPVPQSVFDAADILGVWVENETQETLTLGLQVSDLSAVETIMASPRADLRFYMYVTTDEGKARGLQWFVARYLTADTPIRDRWFVWGYDSAGIQGESTQIEGRVDAPGNSLYFFVPRTAIGSPEAGSSLEISEVGIRLQPANPAYDFQDFAGREEPGVYQLQYGPSQAVTENPGVEATEKATPGSALFVLALMSIAAIVRRRQVP